MANAKSTQRPHTKHIDPDGARRQLDPIPERPVTFVRTLRNVLAAASAGVVSS
jgi:hypothetical protein